MTTNLQRRAVAKLSRGFIVAYTAPKNDYFSAKVFIVQCSADAVKIALASIFAVTYILSEKCV